MTDTDSQTDGQNASASPESPTGPVVMITAGAGGMICGSCLHDNQLARGLRQLGVDAILTPTYTPIRTDTEDGSLQRVFFGGINVYLQQQLPWVSRLPEWLFRWLDSPGFIRWITSRSMTTNAADLGPLTISMLRGENGNQQREVKKLVDWLESLQPRLVVFSNLLIAGCVPYLKSRLDVPVLVTLQGDDVFLKDLPARDQAVAIREMGRIGDSVDGFLTHSRYYAEHMADFLKLPSVKFRQVPLGIDTSGFPSSVSSDAAGRYRSGESPVIGYLARLAPEKGLHQLAEAFDALRKDDRFAAARLRIVGWLGGDHRRYADKIWQQLTESCGAESFEYLGDVDRQQKIDFLLGCDVLAVPCPYREPKGLYALEAMAAAVPIIVPNHGAFPELLQQSSGGVGFVPNDLSDLTAKLADVLSDDDLRKRLAQQGREFIASSRSLDQVAGGTWNVYQSFL